MRVKLTKIDFFFLRKMPPTKRTKNRRMGNKIKCKWQQKKILVIMRERPKFENRKVTKLKNGIFIVSFPLADVEWRTIKLKQYKLTNKQLIIRLIIAEKALHQPGRRVSSSRRAW